MLKPDGVTTSPPTCLFCGTSVGPFHKEDVYPKWLRKVIPQEFKVFIETIDGVTKPRGPKRDNVLRAVIRKGICRPCNGGWMSQLESLLIPTLRPLVNPCNGRPVPLGVFQQRHLAFWALEKVLCLELAARQADPGDYLPGLIPAGQFQWLYEHRKRGDHLPSPGTQVWMFAFEARPPEQHVYGTVASQGSVTITDGDAATGADAPVSTLATLTVGSLGLQVFACDLTKPGESAKPSLKPPGWLRPILVPIWPPSYPSARWLANGRRGLVELSAIATLLTWGSDFAPPT